MAQQLQRREWLRPGGLRIRTVQTLRHPWRGEMPLNSTYQAF
ncbi:hypothetical protein [Nodosilinea sp. LEGE 07088]|nr:hypothetical protein [Nodosilinea sp. LEGE 07088]